MNSKAKKTLCIITSLFIGAFSQSSKTLVKSKSASYTKGRIYISDTVPESTITDNPFDIFVLDERDSSNPNMKVYDSHKIKSISDQSAIIDELLEYEKENESNWHRGKLSLQIEWFLHNILYECGIEMPRTRHVDFDNEFKIEAIEEEANSLVKLKLRRR